MLRYLTGAVALMLALSPASHATSVVRFTFDNLCNTSVRIAHVTCVDARTVTSSDAAGVRTETRFRVLEGVKGEAGKEFTIALPGGEVGDRQVQVPGIPQFRAGEELVIFLSEEDDLGSRWPMGLHQGCYRVVTDENGTRAVRLQYGVTPIPEAALFKPTTSGPYNVGLGDFLSEVRRTIGATKPVTRQ